ncbi:MAG TPA: DUF58 domain-containing protein [Chthoniobacteraceae bacterium]|nr:DUF58 domain-containing protein [Chthoniobacteraceae bacterium]
MKQSRHEFLDPRVLARLSRSQLQARFPMAGSMSGQHRSPHKGSSVEFAEYRKYVPGDDIRMLDWRVFARSDRFYLKEFEADTNLRAYFVLDASASMAFAGAGESKLAHGRKLIATLAWLLVQQGDAVGLTCYGEKTVFDIPARRNANHLRNIFDGLAGVKPAGETRLVESLHVLAERIPARSLVVIVSDCFTPVEELLGCFQHLRFRKNDLAVFHLLDRAEIQFDFRHPTRFVDMENGSALLAEPETIRARYFSELNKYLERIKSGCREFKAEYRRVITDEDYEKAIANFLIERERKKK